ncbi:MAG: RimK/LysX family protein [Botrimarina sp.]
MLTATARVAVLIAIAVLLAISPAMAAGKDTQSAAREKRVIGAKAIVSEVQTGLEFVARIDTGATSCSIHAEDVEVEDPGDDMRDNIDKKVSFTIVTAEGKKARIESTIATTVRVKTSEETDRRYKVWMTLRYGDVKRRVRVSLNDRSHMDHPLLIGRNFLRGRFLVDVEQELTRPEAVDAPSDSPAAAAQ